jgi:hypothetical protein
MSDETQAGYSSPKDIGLTESDIVKRWALELNIAKKNHKDWRKDAEAVLKRYRGTKKKKNGFNILWANTETLRQAIYNTMPKPDVRRRFRDDDPVAKTGGQVLERCADYAIDTYDFDSLLKQDLMDMLLVGRGISRVKYVPDLEDMETDQSQETREDGDEEQDEEGEYAEQQASEPMQRLKYEAVVCEHVQWDDFRHGPGKTWDEVRWVAFRHRFSKIGGVEKFGEIFNDVPLDDAADEDIKKAGQNLTSLFKSADVWEIWDKDNKEVLFVCTSYKASPLQIEDDPLQLDGFFPIPRPIFAIEDPTSLEPITLFSQYKEQAEELDTVSARINNLINVLKVRGIYNSVLQEIAQMQDSPDNSLVPAANVQALLESGGLDKHIWMMPIETAANVLNILSQKREECKAVIYELTGIADIMRGATDPNETKGAQVIKTTWGTQRLKRMQSEFQRYVRDLIRLKCQIIANKFQMETIRDMTGLKLLTNAEKQQIQAQMRAFQQYQQAMQQQQQAQQQQAQQQMPPQGSQQGMPQGQPMGAMQ